ncbi:DMT family transporter [Bowmanella denitrificans]|uniref:DMT family transporter n=1 Tax=Bowmanella denitrificans TaxID=366582 RepID=UPI001C0F054B|nr:DMT family transporter [Bowmanella denitrificans]
MAAFMQAWRNAFQKQLSQDVAVSGVTLARFIYAGPLAALYLFVLYQWQPVAKPHFSGLFGLYILGAALMQILATALMIKLFQLRNYAIGVGLAKSEAILAAVLGVAFFAVSLDWLGWLGVLLGAVAVFLLSGIRAAQGWSWQTLCLGLGSGLAFALTSLWVREASLELGLPFPHGAAWVLLLVILLQSLLLVAWLVIRDMATLKALWQRPKLTLTISFCSCVGSIGWFTAMSLESVALVKTLGQVEVLFSLLISAWWFKEKLARADKLGLLLIVIAAICVVWT